MVNHLWLVTVAVQCTHTHTHTFNGLLSRTTRVIRYQKGKPIWILLKQETVSGSGICWAICKSAPRSRQTTTPAPHHSAGYPSCRPINSVKALKATTVYTVALKIPANLLFTKSKSTTVLLFPVTLPNAD